MIRTRCFIYIGCVVLGTTAFTVGACSDDAPSVALDGVDASEPDDADARRSDDATALREDAGGDADDADARSATDAAAESVVCASTPCAVQLVAGDHHFCALLSDHSVRCWGDNTRGALGIGDIDGGLRTGVAPTRVDGVTDATQISAARSTTCARDSRGGVRCWGSNDYGQLGLQVDPVLVDKNAHPTPSDVALTASVVRVDVAPSDVCAIGSDGSVHCWGNNTAFELARADAGATAGPGPAEMHDQSVHRTAGGAASYFSGNESMFGITSEHTLVGWGIISGRASSLLVTGVPTLIPSLREVTDIAASPVGIVSSEQPHFCVVADKHTYCWGNNQLGALGIATPSNAAYPTLAPVTTDDDTVIALQVAVGARSTCLLLSGGSIQCSGDDSSGQLGRGAVGTLTRRFVQSTAFKEHAVQVAMSSLTVCALTRDGNVTCWGGNVSGELGQSTLDSDPHATPADVILQ